MIFNRLGTLPRSLAELARQDYVKPWNLMLWNNNYSERQFVDEIVSKYRSMINVEVIHSERNHHCVARQSLAAIAQGDLVLLMDDDIRPSPEYISHFVSTYKRLATSEETPVAICACGHRFSQETEGASARQVWEKRQGLLFFDQTHEETTVHFMHANNCMMRRELLLQVAAYPFPRAEYRLVDDYWMSYVLSKYAGARTVKIEAGAVFEFAADAFDPRIAMFNRSDVHAARLKLFDYLTERGWPRHERGSGHIFQPLGSSL